MSNNNILFGRESRGADIRAHQTWIRPALTTSEPKLKRLSAALHRIVLRPLAKGTRVSARVSLLREECTANVNLEDLGE